MEASLLGFVVLFVLAFFGLPLGFAMIAVGAVGFATMRGLPAALAMSGQQIMDMSTNFGLSVLPLFILMGTFIHRAALSEDLYDAANAWLGHRRGGLAMATVAACAGFAAVSGSSLASAATMAKVAMPSMRRYRYGDSLAAATIASGGTLGILIPPSVPMVIYGIIAEADIGRLFIAGIVPGILLSLLYMASISVVTPTEAAGIGAAGALLFALLRRKMTWRAFVDALVDAGMTTGMIFVVVFGGVIFANFVNLAGLPGAIVDTVKAADLSPLGVVLAICFIYILLGMVMDSLAMLLLTVPVFVPVVVPLGVDLIWFGIITIIVVEIGLITPPVGMNVFTVKSVLQDVALGDIFRGVWPFVVASIACLLLIVFLPQIALFLPGLMF